MKKNLTCIIFLFININKERVHYGSEIIQYLHFILPKAKQPSLRLHEQNTLCGVGTWLM